jgi:hypothetical protein
MTMSTKKKSWLAAALAGAASTLTGTGLLGAPIETPASEVVAEHDGWELRRYQPKLEAQVTVQGGTYREAVNKGFRVLAKFIFGANQAAESVEMTAPVTASRSAKIAMTAPVGASATGEAWTVSFTMPSEFTASTLPRPVDPSIRIVEIPGGTWAARRFSGRAEQRHEAIAASLEAAVRQAGLGPAGPTEVAQYDPPWIPGPLRRNEILIPLVEEAGPGPAPRVP